MKQIKSATLITKLKAPRLQRVYSYAVISTIYHYADQRALAVISFGSGGVV